MPLGRPDQPVSWIISRADPVTYPVWSRPPWECLQCRDFGEEENSLGQNQSKLEESSFGRLREEGGPTLWSRLLEKASKRIETQKALAKVSTEPSSCKRPSERVSPHPPFQPSLLHTMAKSPIEQQLIEEEVSALLQKHAVTKVNPSPDQFVSRSQKEMARFAR